MARRESQGLQITLIVFVMLTIILAVTTIAFWNRSKGLTEANDALRTKNTELESSANTALDQTSQLKTWVGFAVETNIDEIKAQYERDMSTYARSAPEVQRTYKDVPALLFTTLQQRNAQVAELRDQLRQATADFDQTRQQLQASLDEAKRIQAETEAELRRTRDEFASSRDDMNREKDQLVSQLQQVRGQLDELTASSQKELESLKRELASQRAIVSQREEQIREVTDESFEVPDGKVLWGNARTGIVYINLGSADGLRNQVSFSVYAVDVNNLAREEKKGTIEVTRIVNDHLAEARITSDSLAEPILPGDVIYTPLWNAKSALRFALAGFMDINGDGKDDREAIKRMILLNNGTIDAEDRGGEVVGKVTSHTRYLIRGDEPVVGEEGDADESARQTAWSNILDEADRLGVEQMSIEKLLDFVGFDGERRTIPLGDAARADDFQPAAAAAAGRGSVFRERMPRPRGQAN